LIGRLDSENQNAQMEICIVYSETEPKLWIGFLRNWWHLSG